MRNRTPTKISLMLFKNLQKVTLKLTQLLQNLERPWAHVVQEISLASKFEKAFLRE